VSGFEQTTLLLEGDGFVYCDLFFSRSQTKHDAFYELWTQQENFSLLSEVSALSLSFADIVPLPPFLRTALSFFPPFLGSQALDFDKEGGSPAA